VAHWARRPRKTSVPAPNRGKFQIKLFDFQRTSSEARRGRDRDVHSGSAQVTR